MNQDEVGLICGFPNTTTPCPLLSVILETEYCKGLKALAVVKELPMNGVDVILGNDQAERLSGNPQVCCFPEELRESSSEGLKYSDLQLPVAVVTRAQSKVVKEKLPGEDEALDLASLFETQSPL